MVICIMLELEKTLLQSSRCTLENLFLFCQPTSQGGYEDQRKNFICHVELLKKSCDINVTHMFTTQSSARNAHT